MGRSGPRVSVYAAAGAVTGGAEDGADGTRTGSADGGAAAMAIGVIGRSASFADLLPCGILRLRFTDWTLSCSFHAVVMNSWPRGGDLTLSIPAPLSFMWQDAPVPATQKS